MTLRADRRSLFIAAALAIIGAFAGTATSSQAHNFGFNDGSGGVIPTTINPATTCWAEPGPNPGEMGEVWAWYQNNTNVSFTWIGTCTSSSTHMRMNDDLTGSMFRGFWFCTQYDGGGRCRNSEVRLNNSTTVPGYDRRITWCHEMGHALGLGHDDVAGTCMNSSLLPGTVDVLNGHDISHVNRQRE